MRTYELIFIVRPDISEENVTGTVGLVQNWVTAEGNEVLRLDQWGRRRLAYSIDDHREGHYFLIEAALEPQTIGEIERNLKLNDDVLRYLLVRLDS